MTFIEEGSGSRSNPHIESSDSDESLLDSGNDVSDDESSESDEEEEDLGNDVEAEPVVYVSPDGSRFWTPTCDDSIKPHTNQCFATLDAAFQFYFNYGQVCGFDVRQSTKRTGVGGNLLAKYVMCNRGGSPNSSRTKLSDGTVVDTTQSRRRTTSRRCNCKARIYLKFVGGRGYVVMSFVEEHNHPLATGDDRKFLKCNRNVTPAQQDFIMSCSRAKIGATRSHALAKEMHGSYDDVGATINDFKNFSRDIKVRIGDHDADMILSKFKLKKESSNNTFFYDYKVDKNGHLTGLFWADAVGRANFDVFGDIVSFDPTFRTNRYNMVFVPFTGVDNHWKNVTFAAGLLAKENYKNFKWILLAFKKAMGHAPPCVITDQCPAIKKAVCKCWSKSKHRLCMWHIMNKLPSKVGPALSSNKTFVQNLKSVVYSDHLSPQQFEQRWNDVISEYNLESNHWLTEMYNLRDQWIPAYFSDIEMAGLLRTTSRSESSNSFFQNFHERRDTLVEFYSSFESAMDKQRLRHSEDDARSEQIPMNGSTMRIENYASNLYTLQLFYLVRQEIKAACSDVTLEHMSRDDESHYFKFKDYMLNEEVFEVSVRLNDSHVTCSCKFFFRRGYLCRHAFAALIQCRVKEIPREFVKPRWTKNILKHHAIISAYQGSDNCGNTSGSKSKRSRAWFEFNNCMNNAGHDGVKLDSVISGLQSINSVIVKSSELNVNEGSSHRADRFIAPMGESEISVQIPSISKNKGCGSRIKSSRELSMESGNGRKCGRCGKSGHNMRTCKDDLNTGSKN